MNISEYSPNVGEPVHDDGILCAFRTVAHLGPEDDDEEEIVDGEDDEIEEDDDDADDGEDDDDTDLGNEDIL